MTRTFQPSVAVVLMAATLLATILYPVLHAEAAPLTNLSNTMSSARVSTASSHAIRFTTASNIMTSGNTIVITFPADFNFTGKTIGSLSFTHGSTTGAETTETLAAVPSATAWGAVFSGTQNRILTLTAPTDGVGAAALNNGRRVILSYDSTNSVNPTTAGSYVLNLNVNSGVDTGEITMRIITDDTVVVSGTVTQSINFTISANTIAFGTLDSAAPRYANTSSGSGSETIAHTLAVGTNAPSGYTISVQGATLTSQQNASNTITAIGASPAASSPGTEQFGIYATRAGGVNGTIATPYATASSFGYNATATTSATFASGTSATATETYSLRYLANISPQTEAGTYTASLVYVATANF